MISINAHYLPHDGKMLLLAGVCEYDTNSIVCLSHVLRSDNPLTINGQISGLNIVEYAAQTAAVHLGLLHFDSAGQSQGSAGVITTIRNVNLPCEVLPLNFPLTIQASCRAQTKQGCRYRFVVSSEATPMGDGELTIAFQSKLEWSEQTPS